MFEEKRRKPIRMSVKKKVYEQARGKCERCGIKMTMKQGNFHHTRSPYVSATAKTVQFLCPNCHEWYGHQRTTRTRSGFFFDEKVVSIKREKVAKAKPSKKGKKSTKGKSKSKTRPKKRKAPIPTVGGKERSRTKSGRWRKKRSDAGKPKKK